MVRVAASTSQDRWTPAQYQEYLKTGKAPGCGSGVSKYRNHKTELDGITFDSMAEANYCMELRLRKRSGDIRCFCRQPKYVLEPGFAKNGKRYAPITYRADFLIIHTDGTQEVVDVKGVLTKEFQIKRKLFERRYPDLTLTIVKVG